MKEFMAITKALSDPNRVRVLLALRRGELCVCQITELFGFAPSTVSRPLSILRAAEKKSAGGRPRGARLGDEIARPNRRSAERCPEAAPHFENGFEGTLPAP